MTRPGVRDRSPAERGETVREALRKGPGSSVDERCAHAPSGASARSPEVWYDAGRCRAGGGLGSGLIGYRRATSGEWALLLTCGLRAGIEVAVLRLGASDVVLGAHGAANLGPWFSGSLTLGYRGRAGPR